MTSKASACVHAGHNLDTVQSNPFKVVVIETIVDHSLRIYSKEKVKVNKLQAHWDALAPSDFT